MGKSITILYFAWLREQVGTSGENLFLPEGVGTVGQLMQHLASRGPGFETAFRNRPSIRCAVNQEFAGFTQSIAPGDEIAFFPPVTGG